MIETPEQMKELIGEQVLAAIAIHSQRNWDQWVDGMAMVLTSELPSNFDIVKVKEEIQKQLFEQVMKGCCPHVNT